MWNDKHYKIGLVRYNSDTIFSYFETGNIDADDSDRIVQYAPFGELKYY